MNGNEYPHSNRGLNKGFLAILILLITSIFIVTTASANLKLETNYHVYIDDIYIGVVTDEKVVEEAIERTISNINDKYPDLELKAINNVTYISEQVFRSNANDQEVGKKVEEMTEVHAIATALTINGKPIVYLKNDTDAKETLKMLKLEFVSKKELSLFESNNKKATNKVDSDIIDIKLDEKVEFQDETVQIEKIKSTKDALKLLQKGTLEDKKHTIVEGEVLGTIASKYDLTNKQLMELNEGLKEDSILQIGQELNTVITKPLLHVVVERETTDEKSVPFETEVIEDNNIPKGESKIKQEGKNGKSKFTYKVIEQNGKQVKKKVLEEVVIEKPVKKITRKGTKVIPSRGSGQLAWPTNGGYVSSKMGKRWGRLHKGIDIARPSNYTIKAADHGIVVSAGWDSGGYGNKIIIDHQNGTRTLYAHLKSINVSAGQKVEKGTSIGVMGNTGNSQGVHLHFEVYKNGKLQNPLNYL